jgi:hypothetical protein
VKKSGKLTSRVLNSDIAINFFPTIQISLGLVTLFEKIYEEGPILTVFSNIGEDENRHFSLVYNVKSASQRDTMP